MPRPKLLTSSQLADELGISRRSVARYVQAGILEPDFYTPGGQGRFDLELEATATGTLEATAAIVTSAAAALDTVPGTSFEDLV